MSSAGSLAALALKEARRELSRKAAAPMGAGDWRMEGAFPLEACGKGRWHLRLDPENPLRLRHLPSRRCLCPAFREMETDLASIPALARLAGKPFKALHLQADSYPRSAVFHDALYAAGWCWVVSPVEKLKGSEVEKLKSSLSTLQPFNLSTPRKGGIASRARVTRAQADAILYLCLACEGATAADGLAYHTCVRAGGASHWNAARREAAGWPLLFGESAAGVPAHAVAAQDGTPRAAPQAEPVAARSQGEDQGGEEDDGQQDGNGGFHGTRPDSKSAPERQEQ